MSAEGGARVGGEVGCGVEAEDPGVFRGFEEGDGAGCEGGRGF